MLADLLNAFIMIAISAAVVTFLVFVTRGMWRGARRAVGQDDLMAVVNATREPRCERLVTPAELAQIEASWEAPAAERDGQR